MRRSAEWRLSGMEIGISVEEGFQRNRMENGMDESGLQRNGMADRNGLSQHGMGIG